MAHVCLNSNKHKRHPPHKKDFSDDDDEECDLEKWTPPTKAARKMFADDMELEPLITPAIAPISPDAISSMPKPPTISETIFRLHQNLTSSIEKPKERKRKKKSVETAIPAHLEHHLYAKPTPCVSSCAQPMSNANYGYFTPFLLNESQMMQTSDSSKASLTSNSNTNTLSCGSHLNSMSSPVHMTSQLFPSINHAVKPFNNNSVKIKTECTAFGKETSALLKPPDLIPYNGDMFGRETSPASHPPLLKPREFPALSFIDNNYTMLENIKVEQQMVEASTSTEDLNGSHLDSSSSTSSIPLSATNLANVSLRVFKLYKIA